MAATGALLCGVLGLNYYLRSAGRATANFFMAALFFNTSLFLGYFVAPHVLGLVDEYHEYRIPYTVMYSALIGFFGVPSLLQLLLFLRESYNGAKIPAAFWNSHQKLLLGHLGTNLSWAVVSAVAGLSVIVTRLLIEWVQRSWA